jgi:Flp pilus assembly protein TadG
MLKKYINNESGQSMVLVALLLTVLLGFGALAVDIGYMTYQRSSLQNAADSAALAGAMLLDESDITNKITEYAYANITRTPASDIAEVNTNLLALNAEVLPTVNTGSRTVLVIIRQEVPKFLGGVLSSTTSTMEVKAKAKNIRKWSGEALPFLNTGYEYNSSDIVLRTNTSPGDKSQIFDFYSKIDELNVKRYYVDYSDGVILDQGNGNTQSVIDGTRLNLAVADILDGVEVGDKFYLLSLKSDIIERFFNGEAIRVTDKNGNVVDRYATSGGLKEGDNVDPSMLILVECEYVSHKIANGTEITLSYTGNEYDVMNGVFPPNNGVKMYTEISKLIE